MNIIINLLFSSIQLLNKNKDLRLGSKNDVDEIKSHDFFRAINWSDLESKKIQPPFNPNVVSVKTIKLLILNLQKINFIY